MKNKIMNIGGVSCYEMGGTAYLSLESVARGLGFTRIAASGNETIRWDRVHGYLAEFGVPRCGHDAYIPENIFYRLAMKAKNEVAEAFQEKVANEIIPSIRKTGGYISGQNEMSDAELMAKAVLMAQRTIEERDKRILELAAQTDAMRPKALFADAVSASKTTDTLSSGEEPTTICRRKRAWSLACSRSRKPVSATAAAIPISAKR